MAVLKASLLILPVDCLEPIVSLLPAYNVAFLWMTGNLRLRTALSKGGAASKLKYTFETWYPLLWPCLIASLPRLVDISITVGVSSQSQADFSKDISSLPSNLENLTLDFCNSLTLFKEAYVADPSRFYKLKRLWITMYKNETVDLDLSPLRELSNLKIQSQALNPHCDYRPSILVVPPHLTALSVVLHNENLMQLIPKLPATLTFFSLRSNMFFKDWQLLPSGLIHFEHSCADGYEAIEDMSTLPKTLQTLSLGLKRFGAPEASQLPRTLTSLTIELPGGQLLTPDRAMYASLPSNLIYLAGLFPDLIDDEIASVLPRRLKSGLSGVSPDSLTRLPTGVSSLSLNLSHPCPPDIRLFPYLTSLDCAVVSLPTFRELPRTLETLRIHKQVSDISASVARQLPPRLTSLLVHEAFVLEKAIELLPRTLMSLDCNFESATDLPHHCPLLPPALTELQASTNIASLSLMTSLLKDLPKLTSLAIGSGSDLAWTAALPPFGNLKNLTIRSDDIDFSNARLLIQSLPKRIQKFVWHCRDTDLATEDFAYLPQSLTYVNITEATKVDMESARDVLPRFVEDFYLYPLE